MTTFQLRDCVWETTLRCNLNCRHCGSAAGSKRHKELDFEQANKMINQLAQLGCQRVIMAGGEPFLRTDVLDLSLAIKTAGMKPCLISNGQLVPRKLGLIKKMELHSIGLSLDGLEQTHNYLRNHDKSFKLIMEGLADLKKLFLDVYVITQVNKLTWPDLPALYELLAELQIDGWQLQLTSDMGRAESMQNKMLSPAEIKALLDYIIDNENGPLKIYPADCLGYYYRDRFKFSGCHGGISAIGIEADGTVKPCLSMQKNDSLAGGNILDRPLADIWHDPDFAKINRHLRQLTGYCAICEHSKVCRGGCVGTALSFDSLTQYPFCIRAG